MGLNEDYNEIIENNRLFVHSTFPSDLKRFFESYKSELERKINSSVFDIHDVDEVRICLKGIHNNLINEKIHTPQGYINPVVFDWINIVDEVLEIGITDLETSTKFLWNKPYSLEDELCGMIPLDYSIFMRHVRHTIKILVLKKYSEKFKNSPLDNVYPFLKDGYHWFLEFENHFNQESTTIKYTMIYEFLEKKGLILSNFEQYRLFVFDNCKAQLGNVQFSRRADTSGKDVSNLTDRYFPN